jgi:uncharacterized protein
VDREVEDILQHDGEAENLFGVRGSGSMISLTAPLSEGEIAELDEFLMSDATPEECMDISTLDGFLTSLVIGPQLVPPSVWLKAIWGGETQPAFESSAQAQRVISLIMRRFNAISGMFDEPPGFAPILCLYRRHG